MMTGMRHKQLRLLARASMLSVVASLAGMAAPAHAQTRDAAGEGSSLEDIIVTARRVEENQQKVPIAVSTLSATALETRNVSAVNDIQFSVSNLQIKPGPILRALGRSDSVDASGHRCADRSVLGKIVLSDIV